MAVGIGVVAVCGAVAAILLLPLIRYIRLCLIINKFRGPPAIPLLGNVHQLKQDPFELVQQVAEWAEDYRVVGGGIMRIWMGVVPVLFIYNPESVERLLSSTRHISKSFMYTFLEPWLGLGLLTSTGKKWFKRRKMLTPTFHFSILQNFVEIFNEQSIILSHKLEQYADKPTTVNIYPLVTLCVLDIICETAMGKKLHVQEERENEYVNAITRIVDIIQERQKKPWYWPSGLFNLTRSGREHARCLEILYNMTNKIIAERSQETPKQLDVNNCNIGRKSRIAFLDLLLKMQRDDPSFTMEDIREEVDTFMFEGHDTTAALASWTIFMLGHHPKVQEKLHLELDEVFGDSDRRIASEDLQRLPYLACVLKETLRLFPPVPIVARDLYEDFELNGKFVPKGTILVVHFGGLHHDPGQFPDHNHFIPDRFLPENASKRHPFSFAPFSAGPRNCIGQKFAMMEDKILIANLLRRFRFESTQSIGEVKPLAELILRPSAGLDIKVFSRKTL